MKKKTGTKILVLAVFLFLFASKAMADYFVIQVDCCKFRNCYVVSKTRFNKRHKAKQFPTRKEAEAYLPTLSGKLKAMHPRIIAVEK